MCISDNDEACSEHFFDFAESDFRQLCISDNDEAGSEHFFFLLTAISDSCV